MFALSSLQIRTFRWPPLLKTSLTSFGIHTSPSAHNTHAAWHKTYLKPLILTSSLSTAPHSFNQILFSAAFWLLKGLSFVTPHPPIRSSPPSSFFAFSPSMTKHSKADNPALLSLPHFSLAFAYRFSPAIESKLVQEQGVIFLKKNCSNDYHTRTSAFSVNPIRSSPMNLPQAFVPLSPFVPTTKIFALTSQHPLCNSRQHYPHTRYLTSISPKRSTMLRVSNPIPFPIPKAY